ncbi:MAG: class I SAM-dependent methyltransferase [Azovibrio sp.]|nr:class I SAM-dependent methyltransferase [Azovibrio sp.]
MSLRLSYTCLAPFYDKVVERASRPLRQASLAHLPRTPGRVLLAGLGTGLDAPWLPPEHDYVGLDLTRAMLDQALPRLAAHRFSALQGDVHALPFADASFDHAVLHLILAVVPRPVECLREAARVVKPGGQLLILDKFLRPGQKAPLRRLLTPLSGRIATRLDVVFEEVLARTPGLALEDDQPALAGGWFRRIRLKRT